MQHSLKKIMMAAVLGGAFTAPAFAQSSVTVSGLVDNYVGKLQNSGARSTTGLNSGGMTTSWIGFKGSEDLGNGVKANFMLNSFLQTDTGAYGRFTGDTLFSRDAVVGLSGNFGAVSVGRELAPQFLPTILFNPFGDSYTFSPLLVQNNIGTAGFGSSVAGDTGWSNSIRYTTPSFGGLTGNLHYQLGERAGDNSKNNIGANVLYFSGPLALTAYYHQVEVNNPTDFPLNNVNQGATEQKAWMLGGSYDLKAAKLFLTYGQTKHDIALKDKTAQVGASIPLGNGKVLASYATTKRDVAGGSDPKRNTASVGYDYDLSKRTDLYAIYMSDKITALDRGNSFGVGVRHRF
jgi:predicted porin